MKSAFCALTNDGKIAVNGSKPIYWVRKTLSPGRVMSGRATNRVLGKAISTKATKPVHTHRGAAIRRVQRLGKIKAANGAHSAAGTTRKRPGGHHPPAQERLKDVNTT